MLLKIDRLMKAQTLGDTSSLEFMRGRRIFEINPDHPIVKDLNVRFITPNTLTITDVPQLGSFVINKYHEYI
jgi:HSP90 family molecular chaperone